MKKITVTVSALLFLFLSSLFVSCSKSTMDETNCYISFEEAKKAASKSKQNILVIITQEEGEQNGGSSFFVNNILLNDSFREYTKDKFVLYRLDFSQKNLLKSNAPEEATEKEIKEAKKFGNYLQEGIKLVSKLGIQYTPSFFILTKDGYYVSVVEYTEDEMNVDAFIELLKAYWEQAKNIQDLVDATKKGTKSDKFNAIEALFAVTPPNGQLFLFDFAREAVKIDPNNDTGLTAKYFYMIQEEKVTELYQEQKYDEAIQVFIDAAEGNVLDAQYKQRCYYMSAWILESINSMDSNLLIEYLTKAYEADSSNELAPLILDQINYYKIQFAQEQTNEQANEQIQEESK